MTLLSITPYECEMAYQWLFQQRKHYPANADIWSFRRDWEVNKAQLLDSLNAGHYVFSPLKHIYKHDGQVINLWSSQDALVLKVLSQLLLTELDLPKSCMHVKGHGGLKQCVAGVQENLKDYQFVCKTDVLHYYESVDQHLLIEQPHQQIDNKILRRYLYQVVQELWSMGGIIVRLTRGYLVAAH